jgi:hypothetical protein
MGGIYEVHYFLASGAKIYIPGFIKIGSGIQKFIWGYTQTHRQHDDLISLFYFFKIRRVG